MKSWESAMKKTAINTPHQFLKRHCCVALLVLLPCTALSALEMDRGKLEAEAGRLQALLDSADQVDRYSPQAIEHHLALGDTLQQLRRHAEAADVLDQALQLVRINSGLYAPEQIQVLERLTENAWQAQDWRAVENHLSLTMNIAENSSDISPSHYEELVRKFANWKIQVYRNDLDVTHDALSVQDGVAFYQDLLDGLSEEDPDYLAKKIQYVTELGMARYYAAMAISDLPFDEFESIGPETLPGLSCMTILEPSSGRPVRTCESKSMPNPGFFESRQKAKLDTLQGHISWIRRNFMDLIAELEAREDSDPVQLAQVVLSLGDMNFLLEDTLRARTQYARAFEILQSNGVDEAVQIQLMGQPQEISERMLANMGLPLIEQYEAPTGTVSFDVTEDGTIRNLGISGTGADLEEDNQQLITTILRHSVYRPKLEAGEPVEARLQVSAANL